MKLGENILESYSFSRLRRFADCPLSYYKRYIAKEDDNVGHGTSEFGTFIHLILEKYSKNELKLEDMLMYYIGEYDNNVKSTFEFKMSDTFSKDLSENYYNSGIQYLTDFNGLNEFGKILDVEYEFDLEYNNKFKINGKIDLITKNNDDIYIIDHKSKSNFKNKKEMAEYRRQLYIYSFAVKEKYGVFPKKLFFNMFRKEKIIEFDFIEEEYKEALDWFESTVEEIENCITFTSNPNTIYCNNFCNFRLNCNERSDYY